MTIYDTYKWFLLVDTMHELLRAEIYKHEFKLLDYELQLIDECGVKYCYYQQNQIARQLAISNQELKTPIKNGKL